MSDENNEVDTQPVETETPDFEREVSALKNKNSELLGDLAKLKQFRKTVEELGGIDQFRDMVTTTKQTKMKEVEDSGDVAAIKRQYQDEVTGLKAQIDKLKGDMVKSQVETQLRQAVEAEGGTWEFVSGAAKKRVQAELSDNGLNMKLLDDTGHEWIKDGKDAGLGDLVEQLKSDPVFGRAFETKTTRTGSGATNSRRRPETNPWTGENRDLDAQTKMWIDNPDKARRMMAEAGVETVVRR